MMNEAAQEFAKHENAKAIRAAKAIKNYCSGILCSDCVFNSNGRCVLNDANYIPEEWKLPEEGEDEE